MERFSAILEWPLRDALLAYEQHLREQAAESYWHSQLLYVLGQNPKAQPPKLPRLLRD